MYKPEGYNSVSPYLTVDGAEDAIRFLETVFAARRLRVIPRDGEGKLAHAEVRIDGTVVMLADSLLGWPALAANIHVYVQDVDATFQKAIDAGATPVQEPVRKDDPDKRGGFRDAWGITWWVATQGA